jgi:hypothetical protein
MVSRHLAWIGALAGTAAGIVGLIAAEILAAVAGQTVDEPYRIAASMIMGELALVPNTRTVDVFILGSLLALLAAAAGGVLFAAVVMRFPALAATPGTLILSSAFYAGLLWLLGLRLLGVLLWPWLARTDPGRQLVAMVLGYGICLGTLLALSGVHRPPELE